MTKDELINAQHLKIRTWYLAQCAKYKAELPKELYLIAKTSLDKVLNKANVYHRECSSDITQSVWEMNTFVLPWTVIVWYSQQPKR